MQHNITSGSPAHNVVTTWTQMRKLVSEITWAWQGWLPNGFLIIIAGESGTGKSALALRLCGCFTEGWPWPDGTPFTGERGSVLWCEGEAAQAINLDRARKYGLNLGRFLTPFDDPLQDIDLNNNAHLERIRLHAESSDLKLIVVDSLRGANKQDENSSDINGMIKALAEIARDTGKIIILTHHLRKKSIVDGDEVEVERLRGSSAIVQTARLVWAIKNSIEQGKPKVLSVIKSNLGTFPPKIGFLITENRIEFCEAPAQPKPVPQYDAAIDLLRIILKDGPRPVTEIRFDMEQNGISWRTAGKAKKILGIISKKENGKEGHWEWRLPADKVPSEVNEAD